MREKERGKASPDPERVRTQSMTTLGWGVGGRSERDRSSLCLPFPFLAESSSSLLRQPVMEGGGGGIERMVGVGLVWGVTNALMRKGALLWEDRQSQIRRSHRHGLLATARQWAALLLVWQYTLPFLLNLSASAAFFVTLSSAPISLAVPVTNAVTFASTALVAALLGEPTRLSPVLLGTSLVATGVWLCIDCSSHVPS